MKNIKVLDLFIKAYDKQKQATEAFEATKETAIHYLKNNGLKLEYKNRTLTLCEKKTYAYSQLAIEMNEAYSKQKKIEELSGKASIKSTSEYIRLNNINSKN